MISFLMQISAPRHIFTRAMGSEAVILDLDNGRYFGLDEVSARAWTLLLESDSIQAAFEALRSEYETDSEQLRQDLIDFIESLQRHGLIEIGE